VGETPGASHTHRVLVIDDDADQREAMVRSLVMQGWDVEGAGDGRAALALLTHVTPCVIFLDLMMPGMDGWRFMDAFRVQPTLAAIPIVVVSAYGNDESMRWLGAAEYLQKPFRIARAADLVRRLCRLGG
jgi:CheY-like chemotaxis protein